MRLLDLAAIPAIHQRQRLERMVATAITLAVAADPLFRKGAHDSLLLVLPAWPVIPATPVAGLVHTFGCGFGHALPVLPHIGIFCHFLTDRSTSIVRRVALFLA